MINKYFFESKIRYIFNKVGLDLHRLKLASSSNYQLLKALNRFEVDLVLDVGANVGQFASELRNVGFQGEIISFEPVSYTHLDVYKRQPGRAWRLPASLNPRFIRMKTG